MAYLPGQEGGRAIADILFGDCNPSGRLPITYPRYSGSIWPYNYKEADVMHTDFTLNGFNPQYEFGEGMSYTSFDYSEFELTEDTITPGDSLYINIKVENTGNIYGKEVVQLYSSDLVATISPDIKKLLRFNKIGLEPGESAIVSFAISTTELAFVNNNNEWVTEPGEFQILIGGSPQNMMVKSFYVKPELD
jgi:beta-glucosidase